MRLPIVPTLLVAITGAAIGFVLPDLRVAERAATRRADLRRALGCYLDLVAMSLAGGRGIPEALPTAAAVGSGWAFELLGSTVATARSTGSTPWEALGRLGEETGLPELQDLGSALALVAHDGAKVRESLDRPRLYPTTPTPRRGRGRRQEGQPVHVDGPDRPRRGIPALPRISSRRQRPLALARYPNRPTAQPNRKVAAP